MTGIRYCVLWLVLSLGATSCVPSDSDTSGTSSSPAAPAVSAMSPVDSLLMLADTTHFAGEYAEARDLRTEALSRARERGDTPGEARALTGLGISAWRLGDYGEARDAGEEALALKLAHGLTDRVSRSYNALGLLAWNENRFSDAQELFQEAIRWGLEADAAGAVATPRGNLALVQMEWGDFRAAREGFSAMRDTMAAISEDVRLGNSLINLGALEIRMGNPAGAVGWFSQAREVHDPGSPGEAFVLGHLATAYSALGNQGRAFAALDSALSLVREQGNRQEEASNLELMAEQYREAGDFRRALDLYRAAQEINIELGLTLETAADLRGEADIHVRLHAPDLALELALDALGIHREVGAPLEELYDHLLLAEIYHELGQADEVAKRLETGRRLATDLAVRSARLAVVLTEARIAENVGEYDHVLGLLSRAGDDLQRSGYAEEWQAHYLAARAYSGLGMSDSAAVAGRRALDTIERVRGTYGSGSLRTAFSAQKRDVYGQLVGDLRDMGRVAEAFSVSDAARGRALLEGVLASAAPDMGALSAGELILREIDGVVEAIDQSEIFELSTDQLYARLGDLRGQFETLLVRAEERRGVAAGLATGARVRLADVQAALRSDEALLEYFVPSEGDLQIFVVTQAGVEVVDSPVSRDQLVSRVRLARDLVSRRVEPARSRAVLEGLHDALLAPVLEAGWIERGTRIVVVPHDALTYLPFGILRNRDTGRFAMEDFVIRVLPTASAIGVLRARGGTPVSRVGRPMVFAPLPSEYPATRQEARAVRSSLPGARSVVGRRATEDRLRDALSTEALVHVATHGVLNAENPMFSRVVMAESGGNDPDDDGRLEVHELLRMNANAWLVFLSGCETGLGVAHSTRYERGEDYVTLAQAFLQAGVGNVVATLWPVDDEGAAVFADRFYESLRSLSPAAALSSAQRAMASDPTFSAPYYWAGYQLLGDDSRVPAQ